MEADEPGPEPRYPLSTSKMSKTPSWIMLGFVLGAAFVLALPPLRRKPPPEIAAFKAVEPLPPSGPREPPQLMTIEAVFAVWGRLAVWSDDLTEVALWNERDRAFTDYFEVRRTRDTFYFRSLSQLTRRVITRGKPVPESPLQFTESEEQYAEWLKYGRAERPVERDVRPRPQSPAPPPNLVPIERAIKVAPPVLPALEFPPAGDAAKKPGA